MILNSFLGECVSDTHKGSMARAKTMNMIGIDMAMCKGCKGLTWMYQALVHNIKISSREWLGDRADVLSLFDPGAGGFTPDPVV